MSFFQKKIGLDKVICFLYERPHLVALLKIFRTLLIAVTYLSRALRFQKNN
jgi:hypothetical protein